MAFPFNISVGIVPAFKFHASTIWPRINTLADKVDATIQAEEALIAALSAVKAKLP